MRTFAAGLVVAAALAGAAAPQAGWRAIQLESFDLAWTTINESYYDPEFGGIDWAAARDELRPRVERAGSADEARAIIRELLSRLGRSHFGLYSTEDADVPAGPATVPFDVRLTDADDLVVTRVRDPTPGVTPGDVVVAIDDLATAALADGLETLAAASRRLEWWRRADRALRGLAGSRVTLRLRDPDGATSQVDVVRAVPPGDVIQFGNLPALRANLTRRVETTPNGRRVGLIGFSVWMPALARPIEDAVDAYRDHDGLVIDLRGNPGGLAEMIRGVAGHLVDEPVLLGELRLRQATLRLTANPRRATSDGRTVTPFDGPVALLVDELTGSTSECFAGALQSLGRARVFGRNTMGQAVPALTLRLPSGDVLMYAVGDFVTSDGRSLEGRGVRPDEVLPLDPKQLATGRDPVLEAALRWVDSQKGTRGHWKPGAR